MASITSTDWQEQPIRIQERRGGYASLTRVFLVEGLTATVDQRRLEEALDTSGIPAFGDNPTGTGFENLIATERQAETLPNSPSKARVVITYQAVNDARLNFTFSGGSNLTQTTSATDRFGQLITVTHDGITQGGTINVLQPQSTLVASGLIQTDFPYRESHLWVGRVNGTSWADAPAGTWLCTRADFEPNDVSKSPTEYYYTYEFQVDLSGWQPEVWYTDPQTGRPPSGLVSGVGYKTVSWYPSKDFSTRFDI